MVVFLRVPCRTERWVFEKICITSVTVPITLEQRIQWHIHTLRQRYGLSRSFQNLCHVSCIHFQGLRFYTELEIYIRFNCTKFISQFHLLTIFQAWFITNDLKICLVFVLLHENLVDFLQIKYTSNLLCVTTTYSENTEGES